MIKLIKYLGEFKGTILCIILLLIVQAYCDLALPQYTSGMVDVGIQQNGIENSVPKQVSGETMIKLKQFMTVEEEALVSDAYEMDSVGNYKKKSTDEETTDKLDIVFGETLIMVSSVEQLKLDDSALANKNYLLQVRTATIEQMGDLSKSMISQRSIMLIKAEYDAMGVDVDEIQNDYLWSTGYKMLGLTLLMTVVAIIAAYLASKVAAQIGMNLRGRIFDKVISFSNAELDHFSTASLITRSTNDVQQIQMVMVMMLRMVAYAPILGIGGIIKVVGTKTGMGWIIAVAVFVVLILVSSLMVLAMPKFKIMQVLVDRLNLVSREILTGIPVIRAFSREKHEKERFDEANVRLRENQLFTNRVMVFMMPMMMFIMNGVSVMIVWFGAKGVDAGDLQVGDMIAFISYTMQIIMAFLMLTMLSVMLPRAAVAANRIEEVMDTVSSIVDKKDAIMVTKETAKGKIIFDNVSFTFPGADESALEKISFTAEPGKVTAIVGSTGCGKSTLVHLIPRFFDVSEGSITLDGTDIRELNQNSLRDLIGYVPQKAVLFSGDIESNLKFAGEWIDDDMMHEAAEIAQAADFIQDKDAHYQSAIAQGGTNVSGGQKQRLSIARAIAKKPKIYLFDDSFSALDYKTDVVLRKALHDKTKDATVFIVAQRISTILHADQIIVLDDGHIEGIGTHQELLESCEAYLEIAQSQLSESELKGGHTA